MTKHDDDEVPLEELLKPLSGKVESKRRSWGTEPLGSRETKHQTEDRRRKASQYWTNYHAVRRMNQKKSDG